MYVHRTAGSGSEKICANTGDSISYSYDAAGNRTGMSDGSGDSSYTYDGNNHLTGITKDGAVQVSYRYDEAGNVLSVTDSKGNETSYTWDKSNRMKTVSFDGRTLLWSMIQRQQESVTMTGSEGEYTFRQETTGC